jgi:DNA polymerase III subunit epsilon
MREICLDTETTGLDPKDGHKIIEIACFELINKVKTGKVFHSFVNPRRDVPQEAFRIHGISTEFLKDKPTFDLVADKFLDFIGDDILVIHNASFDIKFLNFELNILRKKTLEMSRVIDSLMLARKKFPGGQNSLDALCKRFNLDLSKREKHGALIDTELLCNVYIELMGGAQEGFGFDNVKKNEATKNNQIFELVVPKNNKKIIPARNFDLTSEELREHEEFINRNFKTTFWNNASTLK